jgi:hypothetical protein
MSAYVAASTAGSVAAAPQIMLIEQAGSMSMLPVFVFSCKLLREL